MGLANKMAALQQQQGGAPPQQQQQQGGYAPPQGAPPPQQYGGYAPPPGGPPPQQQQQQQYGAPPGAPPQQQYQQPQQQYYAPPPPARSAIDPRALEQMLEFTVKDQNLQAFYPPGSLGPIAQRIIQSGAIDQIGQMFKLDPVGAMPLAKLALFDISLLCDDSGSMAFTKWNGERLDDLNLILSKVSTAASLFDADGITIRFLNSTREGNNVRTEQEAMQLLHGLEYKYQTPLGGALDKKILQPFVLGPALSGRMQKPALIIIITDGAPSDGDLITRVIKDANSKLKRTRYGADAISIQIAQVGNDLEAQDFLASIDADRTIGDLVDCTSNFESESAEMEKKTGKPLTPEGWLLKMLLGGIDSSYDRADEAPGHGHGSSSHSSGGGLFGGGGSSSGKKSKFGGLFSKK